MKPSALLWALILVLSNCAQEENEPTTCLIGIPMNTVIQIENQASKALAVGSTTTDINGEEEYIDRGVVPSQESLFIHFFYSADSVAFPPGLAFDRLILLDTLDRTDTLYNQPVEDTGRWQTTDGYHKYDDGCDGWRFKIYTLAITDDDLG